MVEGGDTCQAGELGSASQGVDRPTLEGVQRQPLRLPTAHQRAVIACQVQGPRQTQPCTYSTPACPPALAGDRFATANCPVLSEVQQRGRKVTDKHHAFHISFNIKRLLLHGCD